MDVFTSLAALVVLATSDLASLAANIASLVVDSVLSHSSTLVSPFLRLVFRFKLEPSDDETFISTEISMVIAI